MEEHTLDSYEWKGAVLFLCNGESVFFIKRSEFMPSHAGQIAFFGGHRHAGEVTPWEVAQREFEEETSLNREVISFLGYLPVVLTSRGQTIVPVVASLKISTEEFFHKVKSNGEWDDILIYPWKELIVEESWEFAWRNGETKTPVMFHTIHSGCYITHKDNERPHILWGATATMVWSLLKRYFA